MYDSIGSQALEKLCERESYWLRKKAESLKDKKIAIFTTGPMAVAFYHTLLNDYGMEAELFIDNNIALNGTLICEKPILFEPWKENALFQDEYVIFVATSQRFFRQIRTQLEVVGCINYIYSWAFEAAHLFGQYQKMAKLLDDELSVLSYWGTIYDLLVDDNQFIIPCENSYFGHKEFQYPLNHIVVDAGATNGEQVEEYVRRTQGYIEIHAFEPDEQLYSKLAKRIQRLTDEYTFKEDAIKIVEAGVGKKTERITIPHVGRDHAEVNLQVYSLDDYFHDKEPFTLLKADIEGMELDLLMGAEKMIEQYRPHITIRIYHSAKDFYRIMDYLQKLAPYKFAVRNHLNGYEDTTLYCWL